MPNSWVRSAHRIRDDSVKYLFRTSGVANSLGNPLSLGRVVNRHILPARQSEATERAIPTDVMLASQNATDGTRRVGDQEATCIDWECPTW